MTRTEIIKRETEKDAFVQMEDGYWIWFPEKGQGGCPSYVLRIIAQHLDELNQREFDMEIR
jgi:hypothetical protein